MGEQEWQETRAGVIELREAARRTYLIDDFDRWDAAIHAAVGDFSGTFGLHPTRACVHPTTLARFGARARPEHLRDEDGRAPAEGEPGETPLIAEFATDAYAVGLEMTPQLWPVELVLWSAPEGEAMPEADTPPPPALTGAQTSFEHPNVVRPAHAAMTILAAQCMGCRHLQTLMTCRAFPGGIPLRIAASLHDHQHPFEGDGGLRWAELREGTRTRRPLTALLFGDSDTDLSAPAGGGATPQERGPRFGDDRHAPALPTKEAVRERAKARLRELVEEVGGPNALTTDALCERLAAAFPVTRALLDRHERGGIDRWRWYVGLWHRAQLRRRPRL